MTEGKPKYEVVVYNPTKFDDFKWFLKQHRHPRYLWSRLKDKFFTKKPKILKLNELQEKEYLATANQIIAPHRLRVEFLEQAMAVGVVGDNRAYTRVINLVGDFPGYNELARLSNEICNTLPIIKVTFQTSKKTVE